MLYWENRMPWEDGIEGFFSRALKVIELNGSSLTNTTGLERYQSVTSRRRFLHRLYLDRFSPTTSTTTTSTDASTTTSEDS